MIHQLGAAQVMRQLTTFLVLTLLASLCTGCPFFGKSSSSSDSSASPEDKLISRGRIVYRSSCISCHNVNPKLPGSLGPDVHGSSKELLTARLLHAKYPDGYKPKRASNAMPAMPQLANDIDALTAYLNQP